MTRYDAFSLYGVNEKVKRCYQNLACAIIEMAIDDYRYLRNHNLEYKTSHPHGATNIGNCYSRVEIEKFFHGWWCDSILGVVNVNMDGSDILRCLKAESCV